MQTKNLDIVYCVKEDNDNEELRYSLRSLVNMPHRKVWIFGGCPDWVNLKTVNYVPVPQNKGNKWNNSSFNLSRIVSNDEITEDFIWFNDDFYVLKKTPKLNYYHDRTLKERCGDFNRKSWWGHKSQYVLRLLEAEKTLKEKKRTTYNYELHIPMIFNREKLKSIYTLYPDIGAKRSLYGNTYVDNPKQMSDVKIYTITDKPLLTPQFLSTSDLSFGSGEIGNYIKQKLRNKSIYEK